MFKVVIRVVFLFAYAAFLYASLRHIAYFFAGFEPAGTDWTGAYALAVSIDVTALILTIGVMFFKRGMPGLAIIGVWFFIVCLTGFSWLVNWEYAVQFQSADLARATQFQWINPILASSFAFLNLAYSVIAELFSSKPKTAQELKAEADELEAKVAAKQQLTDLKNQGRSHLFKSWISTAKDVAKELRPERQNGTVAAPLLEQQSAEEVEVKTATQKEQDGMDTGTLVALNPATMAVIDQYPKIGALLAASRRTATIKEVAEATGYTEKWIKNRVEKKLIKVSSRNSDRVILVSLIDWLISAQSHGQKMTDSAEMPAFKLVQSNGHREKAKEEA